MVASFEDAEDLVQETLLRAWRGRESFEGRSSFRTWLYRIATNASLDFLERSRRRVATGSLEAAAELGVVQPAPHVAWLQPYPDRLLEAAAPSSAEPDAVVASRETIELAFLVAVQLLPPRQRAVLILRDVLGWSAREAAELLETTVASVNGALLRARATVRTYRAERGPESTPREPDPRERELVRSYVEAGERGDPAGLAALLRRDARFSMPPEDCTYVGRDVVVGSWVSGGFGSADFGEFKCVVTRANRMPAVACYLKKPGDSVYRALAVDVLQIEHGQISAVTAFPLKPLLAGFGLPETL
jgi:RNA polymerase sigma-70 factor (ECF subfamily)